MDIFEWIERELKPKVCNSVEFFYDEMDSQSDYSLPIIYRPFDASKRSHWRDRGSLFDYLFSTEGEGERLLDFGPGDGWPSLIVSPFVDEVVGIDGSPHRVEICTENARRMGISNVKFIYVEPGTLLPFQDNSFDGVMAASSIEQTPDPKVTLQELYRVLRSGGHLRIGYEDLGRYRNGQEREAHLDKIDDHMCRLTLYDRHIDQEFARMYKIALSMSREEIIKFFSENGDSLSFDLITIPLLEKVCSTITETRICSLTHPSGKTFVSWLKEIGFREVVPSHSGAWFAGQLFDQYSEEDRPRDIDAIDSILRPLVKIVVQMAAPISVNPMITAIK